MRGLDPLRKGYQAFAALPEDVSRQLQAGHVKEPIKFAKVPRPSEIGIQLAQDLRKERTISDDLENTFGSVMVAPARSKRPVEVLTIPANALN